MTQDEVLKLESLARKLNANYEGKIRGKPTLILTVMRIAYDSAVQDTMRAVLAAFVLSDRSDLVAPAQPQSAHDDSQLELRTADGSPL